MHTGMNIYTDLIDWVGGYPFEYATPEKIISFYLSRGFELRKLLAPGKEWAGCNQFLFVKGGGANRDIVFVLFAAFALLYRYCALYIFVWELRELDLQYGKRCGNKKYGFF